MGYLFAILVFGVAFIVALGYGDTGLRVVGAGLEAFGALLVFWQRVLARRVFSMPALLALPPALQKLVLRVRQIFRPTRTLNVAPTSGGIRFGGSANISRRMGPPASVADQLDGLWTEVTALHGRINTAETEARNQADAIRERLRIEVEAIRKTINDLRDRVAKVSTADANDILGVSCIVAGLTLATFASDIARWFPR